MPWFRPSFLAFIRKRKAPSSSRRRRLWVEQLEDRLAPASLSGFVYRDIDNDGNRDANEPGYGGAVVTLSGPVNLRAVTAANGSYSFTDLPAGTYTLTETQLLG